MNITVTYAIGIMKQCIPDCIHLFKSLKGLTLIFRSGKCETVNSLRPTKHVIGSIFLRNDSEPRRVKTELRRP